MSNDNKFRLEGWIGKNESLADVLHFHHGWLTEGTAFVSDAKMSKGYWDGDDNWPPDKIEITIKRVKHGN